MSQELNIEIGTNLRFKNEEAISSFNNKFSGNKKFTERLKATNSLHFTVVGLDGDGDVKIVQLPNGEKVHYAHVVINRGEFKFFEKYEEAKVANPMIQLMTKLEKVYAHYYPKADLSKVTLEQFYKVMTRLEADKVKLTKVADDANVKLKVLTDLV